MTPTTRNTTKAHETHRHGHRSSIAHSLGFATSLSVATGLFTLGFAFAHLDSVATSDNYQDRPIDIKRLSTDIIDNEEAANAQGVASDERSTSNNPLERQEHNELPNYRLSDVRKHGAGSDRPWITYDGKVYDITEWIPAHPGGEVILKAAGGSIEPYWDIFSIHKSQYVRDILEEYVIGYVHPDDMKYVGSDHIEDPFVDDPERDPRLHIHSTKPCNAETPVDELANTFFTPNETFYVRNHMWVPQVDADADGYEITIELPDGESRVYTLSELKKRFKRRTVTAVLQCSGNRRKDMTIHSSNTNGLQWNVGAISCAKWEGVFLRDVLADAGVSEGTEDAQHVQFSSLEAYGASIPIHTALDARGDVLLAFKMNDATLPKDHGYPIRVIVPGHVAARCVKWLKKVVISDEESDTTWQRRDYKCFGPNETKQDWNKYKAIQKMPVTSAITRTTMRASSGEHSGTQRQAIQLEGYAFSGGGNEIQRVDVSLDEGHSWDQAELLQDDNKMQHGSQNWCWKRWKYEGMLPVSNAKGEQKTTFVVKATDDAYNTQPQTYDSIYNLRGNLATAWHRVNYSWVDDSNKT